MFTVASSYRVRAKTGLQAILFHFPIFHRNGIGLVQVMYYISAKMRSTGPDMVSDIENEREWAGGGVRDDICMDGYVSSLGRKPWEVELLKVEDLEFCFRYVKAEVLGNIT